MVFNYKANNATAFRTHAFHIPTGISDPDPNSDSITTLIPNSNT